VESGDSQKQGGGEWSTSTGCWLCWVAMFALRAGPRCLGDGMGTGMRSICRFWKPLIVVAGLVVDVITQSFFCLLPVFLFRSLFFFLVMRQSGLFNASKFDVQTRHRAAILKIQPRGNKRKVSFFISLSLSSASSTFGRPSSLQELYLEPTVMEQKASLCGVRDTTEVLYHYANIALKIAQGMDLAPLGLGHVFAKAIAKAKAIASPCKVEIGRRSVQGLGRSAWLGTPTFRYCDVAKVGNLLDGCSINPLGHLHRR
jgi:hypothetical protein